MDKRGSCKPLTVMRLSSNLTNLVTTEIMLQLGLEGNDIVRRGALGFAKPCDWIRSHVRIDSRRTEDATEALEDDT